MYVVCFNGPPESGKDTCAEILENIVGARHSIPTKLESLSMPLRQIAYTMTGYQGELDGPDYARFKKTLFPALGPDGRHIMIDISEKFLKPVYGEEVMANLLLTRNMLFDGLLLVRDSGFQVEVNPLIRAFGTQNVYIVRVRRPGKTFEGDSREWVNHHDVGMSMDLDNHGDLDNLHTEVTRIYSRMLNQLGWKL